MTPEQRIRTRPRLTAIQGNSAAHAPANPQQFVEVFRDKCRYCKAKSITVAVQSEWRSVISHVSEM